MKFPWYFWAFVVITILIAWLPAMKGAYDWAKAKAAEDTKKTAGK